MPEFHAEGPQATVSEGLYQDPYVAAKAGIEPMTLRTKGVDSTSALPTPHVMLSCNFVVGLCLAKNPWTVYLDILLGQSLWTTSLDNLFG